jgi:glycosyltransferase involved in cell wall biosynthesis
MSFLWLTRVVPYPPRYGGDVTYTARLLEHLSDVTDVTVLCYREHAAAFPQRPGLTWKVLPWAAQPRWRSVIARHPNVAEQYRRGAFIEAMTALAERADTVVLDHLGMAWCAALLDAHFAARPGLRRPAMLFIPHDHHKSVRRHAASQVRNPLMRQLVSWDAWKAMRLEEEAMNLADGVIVLTERDRDVFRQDHPDARYLVLTPGYDGGVVSHRSIDAAIPERICVLGGRGSFHKQLVLRQCLTALQAQQPAAAHIDIVGFIEPALKAQLEASYPSLTFRGYVEDVEAYLAGVRLGLMPDAIGGGFKLRALTYVFNRVPILAVRGALDGMGFVAGEHYIEAPNLDAAVTMARHAITDFPLLNRISENAMQLCLGRFDWHDRAVALNRFAEAFARRPGPGSAQGNVVGSAA